MRIDDGDSGGEVLSHQTIRFERGQRRRRAHRRLLRHSELRQRVVEDAAELRRIRLEWQSQSITHQLSCNER